MVNPKRHGSLNTLLLGAAMASLALAARNTENYDTIDPSNDPKYPSPASFMSRKERREMERQAKKNKRR